MQAHHVKNALEWLMVDLGTWILEVTDSIYAAGNSKL